MRTFRLFALLPFLSLAGCSKPAPEASLPPFVTVFNEGGALYFLDSQKNLLTEPMSNGFIQARLSPDKGKVACINPGDFYISIFDLDPQGEFAGKPKTVYNSQQLAQTGGQGKAFYPTWSADGNRFFFLNENRLVVYDYQEKKTTVLFDFPENQGGGVDPKSGNMALSRDGGSLYLMLSQGADKLAFWRVDASGSSESQLTLADRPAIEAFRFPGELSDECIQTLFGSKEAPVWDPAFSSDRRYYFYMEKGSGFMAKDLLKGYDRDQKLKFDVATMGTTLFR